MNSDEFNKDYPDGLDLMLPWPPSVNNYWARSKSGKVYLTAKALKYRFKVIQLISHFNLSLGIDFNVDVDVFYHPPTNVADIDNFKKGLYDALTHADVWTDDSRVKRELTEIGETKKGGTIEMKIIPFRKRIT